MRLRRGWFFGDVLAIAISVLIILALVVSWL